MCIIIDANVLGKFLADPPDDDAAPVQAWLLKRKGKLVYSTGGKFAREIVGKARQRLLDYVRAGLAVEEVRRERLLEEEQGLADDIKSRRSSRVGAGPCERRTALVHGRSQPHR